MLFSSPSFSLRLRIYEEETDQGDGGGGDGRETPDPLIAQHSCPFVRHLIASRGSRGILRGGYLRPLLSLSRPLFLIQLRGARFGCQVHVSWPSMPLDMSPAESRFCMFLTPPTSHVSPRYPSSPGFRDSCEHSSQAVLCASRRFTTGIALKIAPMTPIYSSCREMNYILRSRKVCKTIRTTLKYTCIEITS